MQKRIVITCLINFLIASLMGLALRYSFIGDIGVNYRFLTHAHSHVAMLGWVYLMLYTFIIHYFIPDKKPIYNRLFWLTEIAVVGMMLSFPFQGYAAVSISFSTLHIFCSYYFVRLVWKNHEIKSIPVRCLLKSSLVFMLISTTGVWFLGPAVSMLGQASAFYQIAIQFFLHFQFNGWFLIGCIALFFHFLKVEDSKSFRLFFKLLIVSTILSFALPIQWFAPHFLLPYIIGVAIILQLIVLYLFLKLIKPKLPQALRQESKLVVYMYSFAVFCLVLKIIIQLFSFAPTFSKVVYEHRNFVIGFIHLVMLGVVTGFLLSFILKSKIIVYTKTLYIGVYSFIIGFALTEILLVFQGYKYFVGSGLISNYYTLLFVFSVFLPFGIFMLILNILNHKNHAA